MSALPDWRVFLFTSAMGFVAALLFGLLPTLQMIRRKRNRSLWHQFVVCAQVGASCVLLILAGLLVRATLHTLYSDPGFGYEQVLSIDPGMNEHGFASAHAQAYLDQLQNRLRAVPGVTFVSIARNPPLVNKIVMITSIDVDGRRILIYPNWVGPEFFQTMRIPLLRGRYFHDGEKNAVILSESLARKRWPSEDPIGKQWEKSSNIVVGVVGNTRAMELNNTDATEIYYPPTVDDFPDMSVLVRTAGDPNTLTPTIKAIAGSIDTGLHPTITPLTAGFRKNVSQVEQIATVVSLLGSIAIFLAVVGSSVWSATPCRSGPKKSPFGSRSGPIASRYLPPFCGDLPGPFCSAWSRVWPSPRASRRFCAVYFTGSAVWIQSATRVRWPSWSQSSQLLR